MLKNYIQQNKSVVYLISGSAMAQLIPLVFSPVLSRIYSPADYSVLATLLGLSNIIAEAATLRYDRCIVLAKDDHAAKNLLIASGFITIIMSLISMILMHLFYPYAKHLFNTNYEQLKYLSPLLTIPMGLWMASNNWFQRTKSFKSIISSKILQMSSITALSILLGIWHIKNGLTFGYLSGWGILLLFLFIQLYKTGALQKTAFSMDTIKNQLIEFKRFPLFNLIPSVLNVFALSAPVFLIVILYGEHQGGNFNMCRQLLMVPSSFIAVGFTQVYFQRFKEYHSQQKKVLPLVKTMLLPGFVLGFILSILLFFFGGIFFELLLGTPWADTGNYASIYIFAVLCQFCSLCLMIVLPVLNKLKIENLFKFIYFLCISGLFFLRPKHIENFLQIYTLTEVFLFGGISFFCIWLVIKHDKKLPA